MHSSVMQVWFANVVTHIMKLTQQLNNVVWNDAGIPHAFELHTKKQDTKTVLREYRSDDVIKIYF